MRHEIYRIDTLWCAETACLHHALRRPSRREAAIGQSGHAPIGFDALAVLFRHGRHRVAVPGQHRVIALAAAEIDVLEGFQDWLGRMPVAGAIVLLQIADPDDQFGDRRCA